MCFRLFTWLVRLILKIIVVCFSRVFWQWISGVRFYGGGVLMRLRWLRFSGNGFHSGCTGLILTVLVLSWISSWKVRFMPLYGTFGASRISGFLRLLSLWRWIFLTDLSHNCFCGVMIDLRKALTKLVDFKTFTWLLLDVFVLFWLVPASLFFLFYLLFLKKFCRSIFF